MKISTGISCFLIATLISWLFANSIFTSRYEVDKAIKWLWPPILGLLAIIWFTITCFIFKNKIVRLSTVTFFSIYLIYVGIALQFDKHNWPLVVW
jgi:hypothetical protein